MQVGRNKSSVIYLPDLVSYGWMTVMLACLRQMLTEVIGASPSGCARSSRELCPAPDNPRNQEGSIQPILPSPQSEVWESYGGRSLPHLKQRSFG